MQRGEEPGADQEGRGVDGDGAAGADESDQRARHGGADHQTDPVGKPQHGVGRLHIALLDELRREGAGGGNEEGLGGAVDGEQDPRAPPDARAVGQQKKRENRLRTGAHAVRASFTRSRRRRSPQTPATRVSAASGVIWAASTMPRSVAKPDIRRTAKVTATGVRPSPKAEDGLPQEQVAEVANAQHVPAPEEPRRRSAPFRPIGEPTRLPHRADTSRSRRR